MYRVFIRHLKAKRKLYHLETYLNDVFEVINKKPQADYYESIFMYSEEQKQIMLQNESAAGISDVVTDRLVFDFDSEENIQLALDEARQLAQELRKYVESDFHIYSYFSGSKGFHVEIHNPNCIITNKQFKDIIMSIGAKWKTFDPRVKDHARVFRFPLTKHNITNNYKIPLTYEQLLTLSIEDILDGSKNALDLMSEFHKTMDLFQDTSFDFLKLLPKKAELTEAEKSLVNSTNNVEVSYPDMSNKPSYMTAARYALQQGFFEEGERNTACLLLCSTYKNLGFSKDHAFNMLKATLRMRARRLGHEKYDKVQLWNEIVSVVYGDHWKGGQFKETEEPLIHKTIERYSLAFESAERETLDIKEVSEKFIKFANEYKQNRIMMGIEEIDKNLLVTTGMMVGLLGAPSSGKTSAILNVLEHQSNSNINSLFISADMSHNLLYARLMQRYCSMDFKKILESIENKHISLWSKELKDSWDKVLENYKNVGFSFQSGPSVQDISRRIKEREDLTGEAVKVLAVDYLEKVRSDVSDPTQASGKNASAIADLARDKELAAFLLLQPQKSAGDPSDELISMRKVKGASVIEQDCRVILTTWRPGFNPNVEGKNLDDVFSSFAIVKNNMGETRRMDLKFDGLTGRLTTLTHGERKMLREVEEKARQRKAQAYRESTSGILSMPDKIDTVYVKPEKSHEFGHKALSNEGRSYIKKKDGDMF